MKKDKNVKIMTILFLCIAAVGLAVGFAAFSNTLTISSSATVSPSSEDFITKIYGIGEDGIDYDNLTENSFASLVLSKPVIIDTDVTATNATIDNSVNNKIKISNLSATLTAPSQSVHYFFMIKNEGEYDAYLDITNWSLSTYYNGTCTATGDTTEGLVEAACPSIRLFPSIITDIENFTLLEDYTTPYIIETNQTAYLYIEIIYVNHDGNGGEAARADGPFEVNFEDITLNFSTTK